MCFTVVKNQQITIRSSNSVTIHLAAIQMLYTEMSNWKLTCFTQSILYSFLFSKFCFVHQIRCSFLNGNNMHSADLFCCWKVLMMKKAAIIQFSDEFQELLWQQHHPLSSHTIHKQEWQEDAIDMGNFYLYTNFTNAESVSVACQLSATRRAADSCGCAASLLFVSSVNHTHGLAAVSFQVVRVRVTRMMHAPTQRC